MSYEAGQEQQRQEEQQTEKPKPGQYRYKWDNGPTGLLDSEGKDVGNRYDGCQGD